MSKRGMGKRRLGALAMAVGLSALGSGCANAGDQVRRIGPPPGVVTGGPRPYQVMRPIFGWASPRPLYLSGYAGYNYNRKPSVPVETAYDGRYERECPPRLLGGHRHARP